MCVWDIIGLILKNEENKEQANKHNEKQNQNNKIYKSSEKK